MSYEHPIKPVGDNILVLVDDVVKKQEDEGGLILYSSTDDKEAEREYAMRGTVVAMGPCCYNLSWHGDPWCKVGDKIMFPKYMGEIHRDLETGKVYRLLKDDKVRGIITKEE